MGLPRDRRMQTRPDRAHLALAITVATKSKQASVATVIASIDSLTSPVTTHFPTWKLRSLHDQPPTNIFGCEQAANKLLGSRGIQPPTGSVSLSRRPNCDLTKMSVDLRTRIDAGQSAVEPAALFGEILPPLFERNRKNIVPGANNLDLKDFCIQADEEPWTLHWNGNGVDVSPGNNGRARALLSREQLSDIYNDQATPIAFMSNCALEMPEGELADFLNWWLVLRAALDDKRIHAKGDVTLEVPVSQSFRPDDSIEDMRVFLEDAGFLHIEGMFSKSEMAAIEADFEQATPNYEKGDPLAWFATTQDGAEHLVRMEGFERFSDATRELLAHEKFQRIGRIPGLDHQPARKSGYGVDALTKPVGVVKGISDVPWHKDCSLGRHSYECCSLTVGISVNGAGAESGLLRVVPGSHRALIWSAPCLQPDLDLKPIDLPTKTGDVTVHLSCTQHMSQPPVKRPRKVLYTSFAQPAPDADAARQNRERLTKVRSKTHTSVSQEPGYLGK